MKAKIILVMTLLTFVVIFAVQNADAVALRFLFWEFPFSLALLIFVVFAAGLLLGWVLSSISPVKPREETPS
ncbi:MAG: LapA family protein [Candidatus Glassbacteria bacterium]|nr:LapA family protein [Candidatus Glassbacteria bacterium]